MHTIDAIFVKYKKKYIYFGAYEMLCESLKDVCVF